MSKVNGCSGSSFNGSRMFLADNANTPDPWAFITGTVAVKRVSESAAVMVNVSPSKLNKKLSRIGNEFLDAITLLMDCKREDNAEQDTSNLMFYSIFVYFISTIKPVLSRLTQVTKLMFLFVFQK